MRVFKTGGKRALAAMALVGAAIAGAAALFAGGGSDDTASADAADASTATATTAIKRRDLVEIATEDGTLGYSDARGVVNRVSGTVTWLPAIGRVIRRDHTLYEVDDSPVILMDGRVPAYRPLGPGVGRGVDVRQLEQSLRAAGYDPDREIEIDRSWDGGTTAAVMRWQKAHGFSQSGQIELGRVVFLPGTRQVSRVDATLGGPSGAGGGPPPPSPSPGGPPGSSSDQGSMSGQGPADTPLTTTSTRRVVTVPLDTTKSALAKDRERVTVTLPSGKNVPGRISSVGTIAKAKPKSGESSGESSSTTTATIDVTIRLFAAKAGLDQAPVTVRFEQSRRRNVLAVPVTALVARPGGKFAVQIAEAGGSRRIVAVEPGLYTSGFVEIAGGGLKPGQRVTNAALQ